MDRFFPKDKLILTGNPIRKDVQTIEKNNPEAYIHFKLEPGVKTILIIGGSLGARTINESVAQNLDELIRKKIQVIWQTGKGYYEQAVHELQQYSKHQVHVHEFVNRMDLAFSVADLIISRAGAGTISELCVVGKPVILVPSPNVAEDHQTKNARALVDKNAAVLVKDSEAREKLVSTAIGLLANEARKQELAVNISKLGRPAADELIVDEVVKLFKL